MLFVDRGTGGTVESRLAASQASNSVKASPTSHPVSLCGLTSRMLTLVMNSTGCHTGGAL